MDLLDAYQTFFQSALLKLNPFIHFINQKNNLKKFYNKAFQLFDQRLEQNIHSKKIKELMGNSTKKLYKQQQKIREQKANFLFSYLGFQVPPLSWLQQNTTQQIGISESFGEFKCYKGTEKVIQYFQQKFSQNSYHYKIYSLLHSQRYSHKEAKTYKCVQIFFQMYRIDQIATKMQFNVQFIKIQPSKQQKICWVSLAYVPGYQVYKAIQNQSGYKAPQIKYLPPAPFVYELKKPDPKEIRKICQQNERKYHIGKWNQIHRAY